MLRKSKAQLREEVKKLRLEISCLHYVTTLLCTPKGNPHNLLLPTPYVDAEPIVVAELQRLKEIFHNDELCTQCGKLLNPAISCCPHCLALKI